MLQHSIQWLLIELGNIIRIHIGISKGPIINIRETDHLINMGSLREQRQPMRGQIIIGQAKLAARLSSLTSRGEGQMIRSQIFLMDGDILAMG